MVFTSPSWVPDLPTRPNDSITIAQFINDPKFGRFDLAKSRNPYTCGITGRSYTVPEVIEREDYLARALGKELHLNPLEGSEWEKVIAIFSLNTIDYIPFTHAVHRLGGIVTPASAAYSASELEHQLRSSGAKALATCVPLLENAIKAADAVGISSSNIYLLPMPNVQSDAKFKTIDDLIEEGRNLPELPHFEWISGQGARQVAYLCYSSGTSGLPKAVMISHYNIISNILQMCALESVSRKAQAIQTQVILGALPFSHIYGLVPITHVGTYRGDEVIVMPQFKLQQSLAAIARFKIQQLSLVPPILVQMLNNKEECQKHDLGSVRYLYTGAAPLGHETINQILALYPKWKIGQGYGLTETATVVSSTSELDIYTGSVGSLAPWTKAKIIDASGNEVHTYDTPGELFIQSPSVTLGYFNNTQATAETFVWHDDGRWIRTGDEVVVRKAPSGNEHLFIVDRIKELIKVKGHQVAPAELEAHLLAHPFVADCAVIPVFDAHAGELPKAFVVKSGNINDHEAAVDIKKHVQDHKARHKWLQGGVEFVDLIPKSPSGKILRRLLRERERDPSRGRKAKL